MGDKDEVWKECVLDGILATGGGMFVGGVVSILTLQTWPIMFGLGVGLGLAYDHCDRLHHEFRKEKKK